MPIDGNFGAWRVTDLATFLRERGISCCLSRKNDLVRLCLLATELELEVIDSHDDHFDTNTLKRSVIIAGETVVISPITSISNWHRSLNDLQEVESCDILIYFMKLCKWNEQRLKSYKNDNGHRLFMANHIDNVTISEKLENHFFYVKATCVPETRQTAKPYDVWVLLRYPGEVISGGCTCVV